ncbi:MAG: N-6 DNA methylase [Phycisphaerae bacterium]|nr:N-6 DNA methylase [Phycisphaerae bacterium]
MSDRETENAYSRFQRIRERAEGRAADVSDCRERFIRPLLRDVLGFHLGAGEDRIHRLFRSADDEAANGEPLVLAYCGSWDEDLDAGRGNAQPTRRLEGALAGQRIKYGILVTGERLRLVRAAGDGPRGAHLEIDLAGVVEEEDPESFAAFFRLLSVASFQPDADGKVPIEEVERESRQHAEKVSDDLKGAVFAAAESLVSGLIEDAVASGRIGSAMELSDTDLRLYRDAALTALYRILFILYAEARDPRLDDHRLYRDSYSAQGLLDEIFSDPTRQWPENRCSFWQRLRALFRIYDHGLPPITPWENIPPRGGDFFSAATPEGRILDEARLPDRTVARLMLDLATTTPRRGVGRERVSFRELDIENLGAVYEGLLEFEPRIARETTLEVKVQGHLFALPPGEVVRLCGQKNLALRGDFALIAGTDAAALHPDAPEDDDEEAGDDVSEEAEESSASEETETEETEDEEEDQGVRRGASARLIRRLEPGSFHFVPGPGRKGSGSFYTPRPLVQDLVRHALGPLVEGKTAAELERLRVLDPACGSAHFLVEAMRYLGQALHRAYVEQYNGRTPPGFRSTTGQAWDDNWRASDEDARAGNSEARAWCKRRIAERCLFGVDLNPTAVQLAHVALWIESVAGDRPLTYFEHHIRPGNSLLGSWMARLEQPPLPAMRGGPDPNQAGLFQDRVRQAVLEAARLRRIINEAGPDDLRREGIEPESTDEQVFKENLRRQADQILATARLLFDLRSASAFAPEIWHEWDVLCGLIDDLEALHAHIAGRPWAQSFEDVRQRERFFHWELEFPEVFFNGDRPGFDAVLGNPPWGNEPVSSLQAVLRGTYEHVSGPVDAFAFFVELGAKLLRESGRLGLVLPDIVLLKNYPATRLLLLVQTQLEKVTHWGPAFDEVNMEVCTICTRRCGTPAQDHLVVCEVRSPGSNEWTQNLIPQKRFRDQPKFKFNLYLNDDLHAAIKTLKDLSRPFGDVFEAHEGIHSGNVRQKLFVTERVGPECRPLVFGRDEVRPFRVSWRGKYVRYDPRIIAQEGGEYANLGRPQFFERPKILIRRTGDRVVAAYDRNRFYASNNYFVAFPQHDVSEDMIAVVEAVLNSSLATWFFRAIQPRTGRLFAELKLEHLRDLPMPTTLDERTIGPVLLIREEIVRRWETAPRDAPSLPCDLSQALDDAIFDVFTLPSKLRAMVRGALRDDVSVSS